LDNQLHHYAWNRRIAIVSNTTLFATLRTVASLWRIEKQNKNAEEIANRAGLLYEKFAGFIEDMNNIDDKFNQTHKLFDKALGKLHQGRGNLISQVENLKELGAKTTKSISTNTAKEHLKEIELAAS
jgi:DNA recombination protein RmuC